MANIGISNASYYTDTSISRLKRQVDVSVEKISSNKSNITNGDKTSLVSMDNSFRLDLAATNAAVKNMSLGQAYLSTAISTLDSASAILSKIHELAVLGANGTNSDADNAAINMEAEALADAFHKSMTAAQFKGKAIFGEDPSDSVMAAGGRSKEVKIGVEKIDYDFFYDYENPALTTPDAGIKYEIRRALTNEELTSLLLRDPTLSASALIPGFQFTLPEGSNNIGEGSIEVLNASGNITTYNQGQGSLRIDPAAVATVEGDFRGGSLDISVSKNFETSDRLSLQNTGNIDIDDNNVISFTFDDPNDDPDMGIITVAIAEIDATDNGTNGLLRINLYGDATTPGSGNLLNGDFEGGTRTQYGGIQNVMSAQGFEHRDGMIETVNVIDGVDAVGAVVAAGGQNYNEENDTFSTGLAEGSNTYSISFDSLTGTGTGFRADVIVNADGTLSLGTVRDQGKGYAVGDQLEIAADGPGIRGVGMFDGTAAGFRIEVASISNANDDDPNRDGTNLHRITEANFNQVEVLTELTVDTTMAWGEVLGAGTALRELAAVGGDTTKVRHTADGNYVDDVPVLDPTVEAIVGARQAFTGVYDDPANPLRALIVNFDPQYNTEDVMVEQIAVADYQAGDTAVYKGTLGVTDTNFIAFADYAAAPAGAQYDDDPVWSGVIEANISIADKEADIAGEGNLESDQYRYTRNVATTVEVTDPGDPSFTEIYDTHTDADVYDWGGGSYSIGDRVKTHRPDGSGAFTTHEHHTADGTYGWDIAGTNFNSITLGGSTVTTDLEYDAGDVKLEYVDATVEAAPVGTTVYVRNEGLESEEDVFWVRIENENGLTYDETVIRWEKDELVDYDREEKDGYNRQEIAFYTRDLEVQTQDAAGATVDVYAGETTTSNAQAHIGYEFTGEQILLNNWTTYDDRVEFGSNFPIQDTGNGAYITQNLSMGQYDDSAVVTRQIPTPNIEDMAQPDYGGFTPTGPAAGLAGNPDIQNVDDAATARVASAGNYTDVPTDTPDVPVGLVSGATITEPFSGNALELFTGRLNFASDTAPGAGDNAAFGIYHGPAVVSDQFRAEAGQFLRLNYTAAGDVDDYNVAGYIYEVEADATDPNFGNPVLDENGEVKMTMALSETGTEQLNGRASVEIEEGGDYRFVFIVGTFDKTGGLAAGASMRIDNIVAEFPYSISEEAVAALLQSVNYQTDASMSISGTKTITSTLRNSDDSHLLTDDAIVKMEGFALTDQSDGPFMLAPTLNLQTTPSEGSTGNASVLTTKIERLQGSLETARVQAGSQYAALEEAINVSTDLRSQFAQASGTLSDLNFSMETVNLTRRQMQQDVATSVLTQANKTQSSLVSLVDGSYRTYLNAQFSHLK